MKTVELTKFDLIVNPGTGQFAEVIIRCIGCLKYIKEYDLSNDLSFEVQLNGVVKVCIDHQKECKYIES